MDIEGSGIGLSISKSLMEFMRGDLSYRPGLQGGSIFSLRLPVGAAINTQQQPPTRQTHIRTPADFCVLYVEDNAVNVRLMEAVLSRLGVSMVGVGSGEKALEYIAKTTPDCIFMDINLPGISGDETASRIRQQYPDLAVPMVAVSAAIDYCYQDETLFIGRIAKPFKIAEIKKVLQGITHNA
jgi:CheY-like chemotaxis protein